jgi:hypothetical protein
VTLRAHVQHEAEMPSGAQSGRAAQPTDVTTRHRVWINLGPTVPVGSQIVVRGLTSVAAKVAVNDARTLPGPRHIEITAEHSTFLTSSIVTILRGLPTQDTFGDLTDAETVVASGMEAHISEDSQDSSEQADQRGGIVETYTVRLRPGADVREGDRIRDQRTTTVYRVLDVERQPSTVGPALGTDDVMATCRRVSATST